MSPNHCTGRRPLSHSSSILPAPSSFRCVVFPAHRSRKPTSPGVCVTIGLYATVLRKESIRSAFFLLRHKFDYSILVIFSILHQRPFRISVARRVRPNFLSSLLPLSSFAARPLITKEGEDAETVVDSPSLVCTPMDVIFRFQRPKISEEQIYKERWQRCSSPLFLSGDAVSFFFNYYFASHRSPYMSS